MIVFLIDKISPRWEYTFDFIFGIRGIAYRFAFDETTQTDSEIVYKIPHHEGRLLRNEQIETEIDKEDLLSRLFFVLTRMEEYNPNQLDHHERFSAKQSWQAKNGCLQECICDRWAMRYIEMLEKEIEKTFPKRKPSVEIIPTFDIDNAFAYKYKTGKRAFLSIMKSIVKADFTKIKERKSVLKSEQADPYDAYARIFEIAEDFSVHLFWLVGDYGGKDFNISIESKDINTLVQKLSKKVQVGIHPSYSSNSDVSSLDVEMKRLEKTLGKPISTSRQHFLKLRLPETYRNLLARGIEQDYTMGFADQLGFRNGTAHPFPWFDLEKNEKTGLMIYPFAYMDGTLNEYIKLSPEEAKREILKLYQEVERFGGQFSFIWHNETITDYKIWEGWSSVLDYTLTLNKQEK